MLETISIEADSDFSRYGSAAAMELTVCIMSVRNDLSQVSGVLPTASALTLQTIVSIPPSSAAASHPLLQRNRIGNVDPPAPRLDALFRQCLHDIVDVVGVA